LAGFLVTVSNSGQKRFLGQKRFRFGEMDFWKQSISFLLHLNAVSIERIHA
jgi:hypothetical protein